MVIQVVEKCHLVFPDASAEEAKVGAAIVILVYDGQ